MPSSSVKGGDSYGQGLHNFFYDNFIATISIDHKKAKRLLEKLLSFVAWYDVMCKKTNDGELK